MERTPPGELVLVVDDDPTLRAVTALQLRAEGFEVLEAASGPECLKVAAARRPDVILLDVLMPAMDGHQVLAELQADPETRALAVIFVSALDSVDDRIEGLEGGAVDYVVKPAEARELAARVRAAARRRTETSTPRAARASERRAGELHRPPVNLSQLASALTEREWMVLAHLANNRTERDIARRLGIRPGTVRSHKARIRRKLGLPHDTRLGEFARANYAALAAVDEQALVTP
jgi:DNA-binding response OmpR family regulator